MIAIMLKPNRAPADHSRALLHETVEPGCPRPNVDHFLQLVDVTSVRPAAATATACPEQIMQRTIRRCPALEDRPAMG